MPRPAVRLFTWRACWGTGSSAAGSGACPPAGDEPPRRSYLPAKGADLPVRKDEAAGKVNWDLNSSLNLEPLLRQVLEVAPGLHSACALHDAALRAIARHASQRCIVYSAETGSGASTLLFSHLSRRHLVFAQDAGSGSIGNVRRSPLLRPGSVRFIEGPTQRTLPRYRFEKKLQAVLLDGPHAYPFPGLEYFFFYPHIEPGGLLILDDIHIPTVRNLFEFLREDEMFQLEETVETTAFFQRTEAPAFDPFADGWWLQRYNRRRLRSPWRKRVRNALAALKRKAAGGPSGRSAAARAPAPCEVRITEPAEGASEGRQGRATGCAVLPAGVFLWVLVRRKDLDAWWPQAGPLAVCGGRWETPVRYGEEVDSGRTFELAALAVGESTHGHWSQWLERAHAGEAPPPLPALPRPEYLFAADFREVVRR